MTVAEVTSTIRGIPVEVPLGPEDGLPKKCVANLDTLATIRKELLVSRIAVLQPDTLDLIDEALRFALDL